MYIRHEDGVEVLDLNGQLADGSLASVRKKFAQSIQSALIHRLIAEVEDTSLYLGDWQKGEIQITGIVRITTNRYWTEIDYSVLFPPKPGKIEPAKGTYRNIVWNAGETPGCGALLQSSSGDLIVVRSFRHAMRSWRLELPTGVRRPDESDEACAIREATEECGVVSFTRAIRLGMVQPDTGVLRSNMPVYLLTDVVVDGARVQRDISESTMGPIQLTWADYRRRVVSDEINDARLLAAIEKARAHDLLVS
ncbi:MAG: NUDIX domain-containing protein [Candidatus Kerfeldbacteria bacterium]|nr:NUDIX domain-containing protein [Candidatus Kerfeldbacteria bacterium]